MNKITSKEGRFGNNIYQLLNIMYEALINNKQINVNKLDSLYSILDLQKLQEDFNSSNPGKGKLVMDKFFPKDLHLPEKRRIDLKRFFEIGKKYIYPYLKPFKTLDERICCIHIRSGDIFGYNGGHSSYVQPPLAYYKKIINKFNTDYDKFIIITEPDMRNPCIGLLKEFSNKVVIVSNSIKNDNSILLNCQSLVLSRSSFSDTSVFLNPNLKKLFFWDYCHCLSDKSIIPKDINVYSLILTKPYIKCGEWSCNNQQLKLMVDYKEEDVVFI